MNAISLALRSGLADELPGLLGDPAVKCLIVTGTGEAFSAGGDIKQMQERGATEVRSRLRHAHKWCRLLLESEKPVLAAVNGAAVGAGLSLALLCDLVLISDRGFFRAGFPAVGAAPDLGLAFPAADHRHDARQEILMTNRRISPPEAVSLGLPRRCRKRKLLEEAKRWRSIAGPATSLGLTKTLLNRAYSDLDQFLEEGPAQAAPRQPRVRGGKAAFPAKRRPPRRRKAPALPGARARPGRPVAAIALPRRPNW
jgi:2-(1,2-epoxy-1,2-dihydrophenyl)acetyl-CoA isomerase